MKLKRDEQTQIFIHKDEKPLFLEQQRRISVVIGRTITQHDLIALLDRVAASCTDEFIRQVYRTYFS